MHTVPSRPASNNSSSNVSGASRDVDAAIDRALTAARERYQQRRPGSRAAHAAACAWMPGGNTRTVLYHGPYPLRIASGSGAFVVDVDGHRYLNLLGEYTAGLFGHSHPQIRRAIERALDGGINLGAHNTLEAELARRVVARFAAIEQLRFTNSGTEANLMALSAARALTGRDKVLVFRGGYHGGLLTFGSGASAINAPYDFVIGRYNDTEGACALIRQHGADLACVLVEPMQGSAGCIPAQPSFLPALRAASQEVGSLLILDEVMTSRLGHGGVQASPGVAPDLVTLGKWIGGGMSFGAFGGRADLMGRFDPTRPGALPHAGTFNNNVLTMAAGIAALDEVFPAERAVAHHARGEALRQRLNQGFEAAGVAVQATGLGSLMNLHPLAGPVGSVEDLAGCDGRLRELLFLDLLEAGYYIAPRGFIALTLAVTDDELAGFERALQQIIAQRAALLV